LGVTLQTLKIGKREFILVAKRDFQKLAAQAQRQTQDDYWTQAALRAQANARAKNEKPIPFERVERELNARHRASLRKRR
jgi:siroheme synthase